MSRLIPKDRHSPEQFSLRFRMLMAFHNLTLEKIAEHTGNAISTVGTWKNGRLPNSIGTIEKIAQLFQVTPSYLLTGILEGNSNSAALNKIQEVESQVMHTSMMHRYNMAPMYANYTMPMASPQMAQPMQQQHMQPMSHMGHMPQPMPQQHMQPMNHMGHMPQPMPQQHMQPMNHMGHMAQPIRQQHMQQPMNPMVHSEVAPLRPQIEAQLQSYLNRAEMTGSLPNALNTLQEMFPNQEQ